MCLICHLRSKGKKMLNFSCRINENKETGIEFFSIQVCRPPEFYPSGRKIRKSFTHPDKKQAIAMAASYEALQVFKTVFINNEAAHTHHCLLGENVSFYKHRNTHKDSGICEFKVGRRHRTGQRGEQGGPCGIKATQLVQEVNSVLDAF